MTSVLERFIFGQIKAVKESQGLNKNDFSVLPSKTKKRQITSNVGVGGAVQWKKCNWRAYWNEVKVKV